MAEEEVAGTGVTPSEEESFWKTYMPAGIASTASTAGDASMRSATEGGSTEAADSTQGHKEDDRGGKWYKDQGQRGKGRNSGRGDGGHQQYDASARRKDQRWGQTGNDQWGDHSKIIADLKRQIQALQKCALRHEDSISILRQEVSFVVFLRTGVEASIVGPLANARAAWTRQKEQDPKSLTKPMRATMFACWMNELLARAIGLPSKPETIQKLVGIKWLVAEGQAWSYLKWDQEARILVADESRDSVPTGHAVEVLQDIMRCSMDSSAVTRFFPTRPLTPELKGEAITMILQFALRGESSGRLIQHMHTLSGLAITQLCASQLRPERSQRSGLAVAISKELGN